MLLGTHLVGKKIVFKEGQIPDQFSNGPYVILAHVGDGTDDKFLLMNDENEFQYVDYRGTRPSDPPNFVRQ